MDERLKAADAAGVDADRLVPEPSRCDMPDQVLWATSAPRSGAGGRTHVARAALVLLITAGTAAFAWTLYQVLSVEQPTVLQLVFWVLSTICFAWVSIGSATALLGFASLITARTIDTIALPAEAGPSQSHTALLFPVYREDPAAVAATIDTMCREIVATSANHAFDVFVLSDTQDEADRTRERAVYAELRTRYQDRLQIYVRWRTPNTGKKAGNIRDWVEHFGAAYAYFIILDADSVMSAEALLRLVAAMDEHPRAGLIQTVPRLVGGQSLFARLQQFAAGTYGSILATGLAAWHGHGGNYWGHNAVIRTRAFAEAAGLPALPGKPPLGGHILSHDFVEAALLRRVGWEVHLAPSLGGSYEGCPPTLNDLIVRDRRWAQGNLQHMRLLSVTGLPFLSRAHLAMGAFAYLASPIWAVTLLVGVVLAVQAKYATPVYFGAEASLFPKWPVFDAQKALSLFLATVVVVHLPKILGTVWAAMSSRREATTGGGTIRLVGGVLLESVLATVIAPLLMVTQTSAVLSILAGRDAGWGAQRRIADDAGLWPLMGRYRWHMAWGIAGAAICWAISPALFAWMSPIVLGLLLAAPLALVTACTASGMLASMLATHEDQHLPRLLASHAERQEEWQAIARQPSVVSRS
jgi:membrane glycosyltransferase